MSPKHLEGPIKETSIHSTGCWKWFWIWEDTSDYYLLQMHIFFFSLPLFVQLPKLHVKQCIFPSVTFCLWFNTVCFLRQLHMPLAFFKAHNCIYSTKETYDQNKEYKLVRLLNGERCCQRKLEDLSSILGTQMNSDGNNRHRKILFFTYM